MLKNRHLNNKAVEHLKALKKPNSSKNHNLKFKNILFAPLNGTKMNLVREALIQYGCIKRGANVHSLFLDTPLPAAEFYSNYTEKLIYLKKVRSNIKQSSELELNPIQTSSIKCSFLKIDTLQPNEISSYVYKEIQLGDLVVASTVRAFLCNGPEWQNPKFVQRAMNCLISAIYLIDVYEKILNKIKPEKVVMSHGIYIAWGTLFRLCRKNNIDVDVYGSSYRKNTLRFYHNTPNAPFPEAEWPLFKNKKLSSKEVQLLDSYIQGRETQKDDNISLFDETTEIPNHVREFVEKNKKKKLFCLFTNISWDAFAFAKEKKFESMLDWLKQTVNYFNQNPQSALIIKAHPAEIYHKTPEKYRVRKTISELHLNKNILFITEKENVKPFWLYDKIDVGLIHISTVAIEMALKSIPVLSSGAGGHYSQMGFTIDPESKDHYFEYLNELTSNTSTFLPDIDMARKYMFYRFFTEALEFDLMELENLSTISKINIQSEQDFEKGNNKTLDIICEGILNNGKFIAKYE